MSVAGRQELTADEQLGEGGMRALQRVREENRVLKSRIRFLEAIVMHCSNMIVDAVEQTRGLNR